MKVLIYDDKEGTFAEAAEFFANPIECINALGFKKVMEQSKIIPKNSYKVNVDKEKTKFEFKPGEIMTKQEALKLQEEVERRFAEKLEAECNISMTLTGELRVSVDDGYFNIKTDKCVVGFIKWHGDYEALQHDIKAALIILKENNEKIKTLLQHYRTNFKN